MGSHVVELWPGGAGVSGATVLSPGVIERLQGFNSVQIEVIPQGTASGTFQVVDSGYQSDGFKATVDTAGNLGTITAYQKARVAGVADYVRVQATITAGSFRVVATLVDVPTQATINATISGTITADTELPAAATLADGAANPTTPTTGADLMVWNGATWDRQRTPAVFKTIAAVAVTTGTPVAVWTPASGKKFRLMGFALSLSVAGAVLLKDATAEFIRTPLMAAGIGLVSPNMGNGYLSSAANNVLAIDASANGSVSGYVYGTEE